MYQFGVGGLFAELPTGESVEFGTLQNSNFDFSFDKKELYGRGQYPVKVARGKGKVDGKAQYAEIKAEAINLFLNGTLSNGMLIIAEPINTTIPTSKEVTLDIPDGGAFKHVLKVYDTTGTYKAPMTEVNTAPTVTGTYKVNAAGAPVAGSMTYTVGTNIVASDTLTIEGQTFTVVASDSTASDNEIVAGTSIKDSITNIVTAINKNVNINTKFTATATNTNFTLTETSAGNGNTPSAITVNGTGVITNGTATDSKAGTGITIQFADVDEGKAIQYQFDYTSSKGKTIEVKNSLMGTAPVFRVEFYSALDGIPLVVELPRVTSEKLTLDFKNEDFVIPDFSFSAFADSSDVVAHIYLDE